MSNTKLIFLHLLFLLTTQQMFAQLRINEVLAINSTTAHDPDFGEFSDFLELYNGASTSLNLNDFTLSDNPAEPRKWQLPDLTLAPGQYLVVWTDGRNKYPGDTAFVAYKNEIATLSALHANFRLSAAGESIALFKKQGNQVDELVFCTQTDDVSFGRSLANPEQLHYFAEPTPGGPNSAFSSSIMEQPGEPLFSLSAGFYAVPQLLQLSAQEPNAVIRFTFDGATPTEVSPVFTGDFLVERNLTIKARVYVPGKMPGNVVTRSFFINENHQLPVLAISSNAQNLYGVEFGILQNAIKDREVPANIEYFEPGTGARAFLAGVGLRVFGSTIYNLPQRPISVRFKEKFGDEILNFPLFEGKPIPRYTSFLLRNGGNDFNTAFFRDGLGVNLVKGKMDIDYQDYKPCVVFINGEYSGIYEIRERLDEQYIGSNHEINPDNLDYLEDSLQTVAGDAYAFARLLDFVKNNDLSNPAAYEQIAAQIDIDEFINYQILRAFIGYQIADLNNRYWRSRDDGGKWRWIAADLEHAFGMLGGDPYTTNTLSKLAGFSGNLPEWSTVLLQRLLQNPGFRDAFIQRSAAYLNTIYQPAATLATVDSLKTLLQTQMPRHIGRWNSPPSIQVWQANVSFINTFLQNRPFHFRRHLTELFGKQDSALISMQIVGQGKVLLSGVPFSENMAGPFFKNTEIRVQAIPAPGYRFEGWLGINGMEANASLTPLGDTAFTALFVAQTGISIIPPVISHDTTLAASASPWYGFDDVLVLPGARLTVEAGATILLTDGICIDVQGGLNLNGTSDKRIEIRPDPSPSARRSFYGQSGLWGSITADHSADSILIRYADLRGGSFAHDRSRHYSTISLYESPLVLEYSTITEGKAPLIARGGSATLRHSEFQTTVSCNGFISLYDMNNPLVEHCTFEGNRAINTDAIDLKGIAGALVRHNRISGFLGSNCDGIDLGIYSKNNLLEYNIIHDCSDKGVSIGSQSDALLRRNVIYDCDLGVAVKDSLAAAYVDQCTFYGNRIAVACYEKSVLRGGGQAFVKNSILAACLEAPVFFDEKSTVQTAYSLSEQELLPGTGNLLADPVLVHPSTGNFELTPGSPCIDAGDPFSPVDSDGSRADMGAYYIHAGAYGLSVHINEFHYHPPFNHNSGDWVELYNSTDATIDLTGWSLNHGIQRFVFNTPTVLEPGVYLVVCRDTTLFKTVYPDLVHIVGDFHFDLDNKAGKIALYDPAGQLLHSVRYADYGPWPPLADGLGASVELDQGAQGNQPEEWRESYVLNGTPGRANSERPDIAGLFINEVLASNSHILADEYGQYDDWFELFNASDDSLNIGGLCFTDNPAQPCKWQAPLHFPEKTTIPPHGFLLLWADEEPEQGLLHTAFKLSAGGELVGVFQRDHGGYTEVERLEFGPQAPDITWGRYPDGSASVWFMTPTPGASNVLVRTREGEAFLLKAFPNPVTERLFIDARPLEKPYEVLVMNVLGQNMFQSESNREEQQMLECGAWPSGLYTVILRDAAGRQWIAKVSR